MRSLYITDWWWARKKFALRGIFSDPQQGKEGSSFSEEKEAKRLFPFEAEPP
jgi:hypothetical protein